MSRIYPKRASSRGSSVADHPLYFISCGPGDPDLITVGGLRAIEQSIALLAPKVYEEGFSAYLSGKEVESPFTMDHQTVVDWVDSRLKRGPVAFLLPGDFSTFSPFHSFVEHFFDRAVVIPGVSAHAAAAALLKRSWDIAGVAHTAIITSPRAITRDGRVSLREYGGEGNTLILYMLNLPIGELVTELLHAYTPETPIAILENIACPGERVTLGTLDDIEARLDGRDPFGVGSTSSEPTLALVVVGGALVSGEKPDMWDYRYEKLWKPREMK
ncbi:MAG: hypothetical protein C0608_02620 [Deltaproteobacteria bacterium]|nr:MAG: hypothetical protein C0608_02620 [Deltaproteobacteria bacterium]